MRRWWRTWSDQIAAALEALASLTVLFVATLNLANLVLRYVFRMGFPEASEASAIAVVVIAFLGMARGFADDGHVRFTALERWMRGSAAVRVRLLGRGLTLLSLLILAYVGFLGAWAFGHLTLTAISMPWLPFWIPELTIPAGALASLFVLFAGRKVRDAGSST